MLMAVAVASWRRGSRVVAHAEGIEAKEVYSLTFPETESVKPRCQQGHVQPGAPGTTRHGNRSLLRTSCSGLAALPFPSPPAPSRGLSPSATLCASGLPLLPLVGTPVTACRAHLLV